MTEFTVDYLAVPCVFLVLATSMGLFMVQGSVWSVALLAIQYVGVFVLVSLSWPFPMAFSTLVAGWIATFILGFAIYSLLRENTPAIEKTGPGTGSAGISFAYGTTVSARVFRLLAGILIALGAFSATQIVIAWVPGIPLESAIGALVLVSLGILQLGLTSHPIRVIIGLLTIISGFEIIYAVVAFSALVAGLLAGVTMGLALLGVYLIFQSSLEEAV
jgi:hypothetical protein